MAQWLAHQLSILKVVSSNPGDGKNFTFCLRLETSKMWEINLLYPQKLQKSQCFYNLEIKPILKLKPFSLCWLLIGICVVLLCWWLTKRVILSGDIELNPGPGTDLNRKSDLLVITQNCRGLNEPKKLRDLLNKLYKKVKGNDSYIIMFQ